LAEQVPLRDLHPAALAAAPSGRWAVALSGGGDSVALLLLLWAHFPKRRSRLVALHFDHRLRGAASRADARFCHSLCAALGVELIEGRWSRTGRSKVSEAEARDARNGFVEAACARRSATALGLGQQQDDIAETMLMRLARGSGAAGLAAPRPASLTGDGGVLRLRPLLTLQKRDIAAQLKKLGIPFRTDRSNQTGQYLRNRVRRDVVETWQKSADSQRDAVAGAALSRELLEEDDTALEAWTDRCRALTAGGKLNLVRLQGAPRAVWRRALQRWVGRQLRDTQKSPRGSFRLSRMGFERLLHGISEGKAQRISLGAAYFARIRQGWLSREGG
jgi:tRNA(Ile)-lysidine synthase